MGIEFMISGRATKEEYTGDLLARLRDKCPRYTYETRMISGANGTKLERIIASDANKNDCFALAIAQLYEASMFDGEDELFRRVLRLIEEMETFYSSNDLKKKFLEIIQPWVINKSKNAEMLKEYPYKDYGQYVIVYRRIPSFDEIQLNYGLVSWNDMERYALDLEQIHSIALKNISQPDVNEVSYLMHGLQNTVDDFCYKDENKYKQYMIREKNGYCANGSILNTELLQKIGIMIGEDYHILPSSIHEWIIVPVSMPKKVKLKTVINGMNRDINPEDVLGNQYYLYDVAKGEITVETHKSRAKKE